MELLGTGDKSVLKIISPFIPRNIFPKIERESYCVSGIGKENLFNTIDTLYHKDKIREPLLFIGSCGSFDNINIGELILPVLAYPNDKLQQQDGLYPSHLLTQSLKLLLKDKGIGFKEAVVISVNSLAEENEQMIKESIQRGINCVDMELFYLLKRAAEYEIESTSLLYVTDKPLCNPASAVKSTAERQQIKEARQTVTDIAIAFKKQLTELVISYLLGFKPSENRLNEILRLIFEIATRENLTEFDVLKSVNLDRVISTPGMNHKTKFSLLKKILTERRYPLTHNLPEFRIYLTKPPSKETRGRIYKEPFIPERIYIDRASANSSIANRTVSMFKATPLHYIDSVSEYHKADSTKSSDPKKRDLIISRQLWDFVKPCPCTKEAVCCGYHVINLGFGCPFDCSYCFLQHYANSSGIVLDSNIDDFLPKIEEYLSKFRGRKIRIGTGEFTDSLALDHISEYSKHLIPFFARQNAILELKTKSININNLESLDHNGNTVISWSLNPQKVIESEEYGTPSLNERLDAAQKCSSMGYGIAFHFDPVILIENWKNEYESVVNSLFDTIKKPEWISIGSIRFHRSLKKNIEERFPQTRYIYGEMLLGQDNKLRYPDIIRREIYQKMSDWIKRRGGSAYTYLCMETADMWKRLQRSL